MEVKQIFKRVFIRSDANCPDLAVKSELTGDWLERFEKVLTCSWMVVTSGILSAMLAALSASFISGSLMKHCLSFRMELMRLLSKKLLSWSVVKCSSKMLRLVMGWSQGGLVFEDKS